MINNGYQLQNGPWMSFKARKDILKFLFLKSDRQVYVSPYAEGTAPV
jgi:hypothetical protein